MELVYEIRQSYVPPGSLGILMARFLHCGGVRCLKCWNRGTAFLLGEVLVLILLDTPLYGMDGARIIVNLFGEGFVTPLSETIDGVEHAIKSMFVEHFNGVIVGLKREYPRNVPGLNAFDGLDALVERIDGLEAHLDRELSRVLRGLQQLEGKLHVVAEASYDMVERLDKLQSKDLPCPSLVIVRPGTEIPSDEGLKSSRNKDRSQGYASVLYLFL